MCNFIACKTAKIKICSSKLTFQLSSLGVHKVSMVSPTLFIRSPRKCSDIRSATQPLSHSAHSIWMQMHGARCTARLVAPHTHTQLLWLLHSFFVVVDAFACNTFLGAGWKAKEYASQVDCFLRLLEAAELWTLAGNKNWKCIFLRCCEWILQLEVEPESSHK